MRRASEENTDNGVVQVFVKSIKTILIRITGIIAGLLISVMLARTLGTGGIGVVTFANKMGMILLIIALFGFPNVIIKLIAIAKEKSDEESIAYTINSSLYFNGRLSLILAIVGILIIFCISDHWPQEQYFYNSLLIAVLMLIPQTFSRVYSAALLGYGKIWQGNLANQSLSTLITFIILFTCWLINVQFDPIRVLLIYATGRTLTLIIVRILWKKYFINKLNDRINLRPMLKMAKPMALASMSTIVYQNTDTVLLGFLRTFNDVGVYAVASLLALFTSLFLQVTNSALAPTLASHYNDSRIKEIQYLVSNVSKALSVLAILSVLIFFFFGKPLLGLWGNHFEEGYWVLVILAIGQFFNMSCGCAGLLLMMTGHEKIHGLIALIFAIFNIALGIVLIKYFGMIGAAISTSITLIFENICKVIVVKIRTNISTLPL